MPSNCIYEVFKWMLVVYKYTGNIPLPGLYESKGTSKVNTLLLRILLPLLAALSAIFGAYDSFVMGLGQPPEDNLTAILNYLIIVLYGVSTLLIPLIFYFRLSRRLINYLKKHEKIDHLLQPRKNRLKTVVNLVLIFTVINNVVSALGFAVGRYVMYESMSAVHLMSLINGLYLAICFASQPQVLYVLFQYVLRCAFAQLLREIEESGTRTAKKLRKYGTLYCHLCRMGKEVDDMTSPLIAFRFLYYFVTSVFFLVFVPASQLSAIISELLTNSSVLVLVPIFAHRTKDVAAKIGPTIYSRFDVHDKKLRKEIKVFALQALQLKMRFSASGFFELNQNLVFNIIQSILSQWVVFYKMKNEQ